MSKPLKKKEVLEKLHEFLGDKFYDFKASLTKEFSTPELKVTLKIIQDINKKITIINHRAIAGIIRSAIIQTEDRKIHGNRKVKRGLL